MQIPKSLRIFLFTFLFSITLCTYAQQGRVIIDQDPAIAKLLEYKKDLNTIDFYKIQIFSNANRSSAEQARASFRGTYSFPADMVYDSPNYKIQVGNFRSRLEADRALVEIKRNYPSAFIFKPKRKGTYK